VLLWLGLLVVLDEVDEVVLPVFTGDVTFVGDFVEDVVEVVHGVDHFANVGFL
jgi:hypothetical protein